ncbi:MAG: DUF3857 domain-containing protein [bacterium]|nr:DUF3857 domain-containing protein [bacterium]
MKRILLLLTLLITTSFAFADFNGLPDNVRANLAAIQKYSKASSILLSCSELYSLNADGSQVYEWHSFRYFRDEAARDAWGDPRINFADGRQTVEILRARTYTSDDRQIDCTPENAFNPVVPDEMDLAPEFGEYRQLVVTMLGLENGSISEFHYKVSTPKPLMPWLDGRAYLRDEMPTLTRELTVVIPEGSTLTYQGDRGAPEPTISGTRYVWKIGEQAGYLADDLAGHKELLPNVSFSTAKSWEQICAELKSRIDAANATSLTIPASLSEELAGNLTVDTQIDVIKKWVNERFNKKHFDHPEFVLSLRPAAQVLNTGYGNGLELAVLVNSLAAALDIRCELFPRLMPKPLVPSLHDWVDPVLAIHPDFGPAFLTDALAPRSELSNDLPASMIFDLATCKERETPTHISGTPHFNLWLSLSNLDQDTVSGHGSLITTGSWGAVELIQENGAAEYLNSLVTIPGFSCTSAKPKELSERRVSIDFEFAVSALDTADGFKILPLAALDLTNMVKDAPWALQNREFSQAIPLIGEIALQIEATIPDDLQISSMPTGNSETWDWSTGEVSCDVEDGRLVYSCQLKLAREWLAPSGWSAFRTWMIESGPRPNNCIVFEPKAESKTAK